MRAHIFDEDLEVSRLVLWQSQNSFNSRPEAARKARMLVWRIIGTEVLWKNVWLGSVAIIDPDGWARDESTTC